MTTEEILRKLKHKCVFKFKNKNNEVYKPYLINTTRGIIHCDTYKKTLKGITRIGKFSSYNLDNFIKYFEERFEFIH
jgi:hypothetical protein